MSASHGSFSATRGTGAAGGVMAGPESSAAAGAGVGDGGERHPASSWRASTQLFPTIHLTKEEQIHYDVTVGRVLERTLKEYDNFNGQVNKDNWALVRKRKQMSIYRNLQGIGNPRVTLMMGTGLIPGTVDEVMDGLYCDTTDDLRAVKALIKYKFLDGGVFHVCEARSPDAPYRFAGIKWFAARTPFGGTVVKSRDLLTYERMGSATDSKGNEIAYHILQSINRPEWPADCIKNIRRAYTSTCYIYRRRNNVVECFLWGEFYANGFLAQRLADYGVAGIWMNVVRTPQCAEAKKLTQLMARATPSVVSASGACDNCHQRPGYFDHLRPCAGCRQRICKGCASRRHIFKYDWHSKKILSEQFCLLCVTEVSNQPVSVLKQQMGDTQTVVSASSMSENAYDHDPQLYRQRQLAEYEGNERLSKVGGVGPPAYNRATGLSSTFTHSSVGGRPSQQQQYLRSTIDEDLDQPFALTEANLRSFELGMRASRPQLEMDERRIIGPEDLLSEDMVVMERSDAGPQLQQHDRYFADVFNPLAMSGRSSAQLQHLPQLSPPPPTSRASV